MGCIICGNSQEEKIFKGLTQCKKCELIYYFPTNKKLITKDLYQESYFTGEEYYDYKNDKSIIQKNFNRNLDIITKYVKKGKLFEIGCAYGFFLEIAKKFFSVSGIDISSEPVKHARVKLHLDAKEGNYLKTKVDKKDVFCMWDTIEHLESPELFIKKIYSELNPGGYLFLTTGNINSLVAKMSGKNWRLIHPPTHIYYFSNRTITKLLEKSGFKVVSITHPGIYRSLKQILYSLFFLNRKTNSKKISNLLNYFDIPIYINTFDIMMVVARKI